MSSLVHYEFSEGVATITLDDGKVNVVSLPMLEAMQAALDRAAADRAVVLFRGRPGRFSAGFELPVLAAGTTDSARLLRGGFELAERLLSFPQPVVIACSGHALAMGVFLLLCGDYRIGIDGAYKIGANEVAIGLTMPRAAITICRERLARTHLNRAVVNAEIYTPAEAVAAGFLDRVVPETELAAEARAAALNLAKLNAKVHAATRQRLRARMLEELRTAIATDDAEFRAQLNL